MSYVKQNFKSGQTLYASQLNAMEDQIAANETAMEDLSKRVEELLNEDIGNSSGDAKDAVLYTEQTLTYEQKAQARANISAADADTVEALDGIINGREYIEKHEVEIEATPGGGVSKTFFNVDIKAGDNYTVTLIQDGIVAEGYSIALYERYYDVNRVNVGTLKLNQGWEISKAATIDTNSFDPYLSNCT